MLCTPLISPHAQPALFSCPCAHLNHSFPTQVSDGAAVCLLTTRAEALKRGLPILGIFRSFAAVGVDPAVMGIGPAVAIPAAVKMAGLTADDIDLYELNEAFASQVSEVCG
jgi:acetyl-CoA acyltransferase 1